MMVLLSSLPGALPTCTGFFVFLQTAIVFPFELFLQVSGFLVIRCILVCEMKRFGVIINNQ